MHSVVFHRMTNFGPISWIALRHTKYTQRAGSTICSPFFSFRGLLLETHLDCLECERLANDRRPTRCHKAFSFSLVLFLCCFVSFCIHAIVDQQHRTHNTVDGIECVQWRWTLWRRRCGVNVSGTFLYKFGKCVLWHECSEWEICGETSLRCLRCETNEFLSFFVTIHEIRCVHRTQRTHNNIHSRSPRKHHRFHRHCFRAFFARTRSWGRLSELRAVPDLVCIEARTESVSLSLCNGNGGHYA